MSFLTTFASVTGTVSVFVTILPASSVVCFGDNAGLDDGTALGAFSVEDRRKLNNMRIKISNQGGLPVEKKYNIGFPKPPSRGRPELLPKNIKYNTMNDIEGGLQKLLKSDKSKAEIRKTIRELLESKALLDEGELED